MIWLMLLYFSCCVAIVFIEGQEWNQRGQEGRYYSGPGEKWGRLDYINSTGLIDCCEGAHHKSHYFQPHLPLDNTWITNNYETNNVLFRLLPFAYSLPTAFSTHSSKVQILPFRMDHFFLGGPTYSIFLLVKLFHFALHMYNRWCFWPPFSIVDVLRTERLIHFLMFPQYLVALRNLIKPF